MLNHVYLVTHMCDAYEWWTSGRTTQFLPKATSIRVFAYHYLVHGDDFLFTIVKWCVFYFEEPVHCELDYCAPAR